MRRIGVAQTSGKWTTEERWTSNGLKPYFNDFVVHKGHAYGFDGSILAAIDLDGRQRASGRAAATATASWCCCRTRICCWCCRRKASWRWCAATPDSSPSSRASRRSTARRGTTRRRRRHTAGAQRRGDGRVPSTARDALTVSHCARACTATAGARHSPLRLRGDTSMSTRTYQDGVSDDGCCCRWRHAARGAPRAGAACAGYGPSATPLSSVLGTISLSTALAMSVHSVPS